MLNSASRSRSAVGLMACDFGAASARPRNRPPTNRNSAARRPWAGGGRAPALFPPPRRRGLPDARGTGGAALAFIIAPRGGGRRRGGRLALPDRSGEIRPRRGDKSLAELLAQGPRLHLGDLPWREVGELERAERHADQAVDLKPEVTEHVLHLAVLALADRKAEPNGAALGAIDRGLERPLT